MPTPSTTKTTVFINTESLKTPDFDGIRLRLASPDDIRSWSHGEVTKPETINYRTQKPEMDGLFCERIFGPSRDWECYCGKYKRVRYKGVLCDKCGVEVTRSLVRRERMGHIELAAPVSHIWFARGVPSMIALILGISITSLEKVLYFANFIITSVDEVAKKESLDSVEDEYKSKKKSLKKIREEKTKDIEEEGKRLGRSQAEVMKKIQVMARQEEEHVEELEEAYNTAKKELINLKVYKILSELEYQDLALKYGHVFTASIGAEAVLELLGKVDLAKDTKSLNETEVNNRKKGATGKIDRLLRVLSAFYKNKLRPEWMVLTVLPIVPPDLRPMVQLDGGRFAASDLNDLYRRVINRNNRLRRLKDLGAPEVIQRNEKRMLQEAVDALIDNSARRGKTVTASTGQKRVLKSIADMLKGKQGRFRRNLLGKRVDYSGRSVIVVGPELKLYQCGLPKIMALELFRPFVISELIKRELVHNVRSANRFIETGAPEVWDVLEGIIKHAHVLLNRAPTLHRLGIQAFNPVLIEGKAIQLHPLVCTAFNADFDGDQMAVHVPLTEQAKWEAEHIMLASKNLLKPATGDPIAFPSQDIVLGCYYLTTVVDEEAEIKNNRYIFSNPDQALLAYENRRVRLQDKIKVRIDGKIIDTSVGRIVFNRFLPSQLGYVNRQMDKSSLKKLVGKALIICGRDRTAEFLDTIKAGAFSYLTRSGFTWAMADLPLLTQKQEMFVEAQKQVDQIGKQFSLGLLAAEEKHAKIIEIWAEVKDRVTDLARESLAGNVLSPIYAMIQSGARGSWGQTTQMMGTKGLVTSPSGETIELPVKANFREGFDVLEYFISTHGTRKGLTDTALRTANAGYLTRRLVDVSQDVVIREEDCGDTKGNLITKKESEEMGQTVVGRILGRYLLEEIKDPESGKALIKKGELVTESVARNLTSLDLEQVHVRSVLECRLPKGICKKCYGYDLAYNKPVKIGVPVGIMAAQSIGEPGTQLTMRTFHSGGVAGGSDITQGLPRVEELFEARPPKRRAYMTEVSGQVTVEEIERHMIEGPEGQKLLAPFVGHKIVRVRYQDKDGETYKLNRDEEVLVEEGAKVKEGQLLIRRKDGTEIVSERSGSAKINKKSVKVVRDIEKDKDYIIPPGYVIYVRTGDQVEAGQPITDGHLDLQLLYKLRGKEAVQKYVLKDVQAIYTSQGQKLNDKHIEIIVRQMFSRVNVSDAGDTDLLPGEIIEKSQFMIENAKIKESGGQLAKAQELFLGITKISLSTQSFLSSASFQETARVLINAAVTGKVDQLGGLEGNINIGRRIPAGTGLDPVTPRSSWSFGQK